MASKSKKPDISFLGFGLARKAGEALKGRALQLKRQECEALGGVWDEKTQECKSKSAIVKNGD